MSARTVLPILGFLVLAGPLREAGAQSWRTVTKLRHRSGEERLAVSVTYGAGELALRPADAGVLYRMRLRYDEDAFEPLAELAGEHLRLGVRSVREGFRPWRALKGHRSGEMELELAPDVPLDLSLEFGAARADLELGGLRLTGLELSTGASETRLRVSGANPERIRRVTFNVGAASFRARGLGNLNARRIDVDAGVGEVLLDFTGVWDGEMEVTVDLGLGSLELRFPRGVGVRIAKDTFLTSFDPEGLMKRGRYYLSPDWEESEHRITVRVDGAFGSIDVRWAPAEEGPGEV